ncbi:MAG: hypothetical protein IJM71_02305 [Clostridia bacterium]|nr:hypothetical protein [Clostridia bacterium]
MIEYKWIDAVGAIDPKFVDRADRSGNEPALREGRKRAGIGRSRIVKAVLIAFAVFVFASASVTAAVFVIRGDLKFIDGKIVFERGDKAVELESKREYEYPGGLNRKVYVDGEGNEYTFSEDNHFLGVIYSPDSPELSEWYENADGMPSTFSDEEAIAAASELCREKFGEAFEKLSFQKVYSDSLGYKTVQLWELLGKDGFVLGDCFIATYVPDGTLFAYSMPKLDDLKGFDESLLDGVTLEQIIAYVEAKTVELHGDSLVGWYFAVDGKVSLERNSSGFYLRANVMAEVRSDYDGFVSGDGGHAYDFPLPFDPAD